MSTIGHLKLFSITINHKSPFEEDELSRPTQKIKEYPIPKFVRHTTFWKKNSFNKNINSTIDDTKTINLNTHTCSHTPHSIGPYSLV
jgi:hypothetical protein